MSVNERLSSGKWSGVCLHIDQMLQCSESVYSAVSLTLHHWHTQQSSSTWPSSSSSSGLSQRLLKVCGAQVWYQFISSSILSKFWVDFLLVVFQRVEDRSASLRVPQRQQLDQKKQSKSAVKPAQMWLNIVHHNTFWAGTYRNLEKLLNSWFIEQAPFSQELHLDSVAVDHLQEISLWPSVESRLKMLDIITVRVITVVMCSHSDKESYKNLRQSESRWLNWSCSCSEELKLCCFSLSYVFALSHILTLCREKSNAGHWTGWICTALWFWFDSLCSYRSISWWRLWAIF